MVRISSVGSALLVAASALTVANAHYEYTIRARNLTYQQPFSPIFFVAHKNDISIFKEGLAASAALKTLAEDGDASALETLIHDSSIEEYVCGYVIGSAPQMPGTTERYVMEVDEERCGSGAVISMATMVVNTNDGFVGFDSERLKTGGASTILPPVWDSGTEENNGACSYIPGPACADTPGNAQAGPGEGFVHIHRGVHGVAADELPASTYSWLNPAAEVFIARPILL